MRTLKILTLIGLMVNSACGAPSSGDIKDRLEQAPRNFETYWYDGKAEITRYRLDQARYGELREGDAVLVFVTEDFLRDAQVKRESGEAPADNVLKLNFTKKFNTGIYPYSIMTSIFTKADAADPATPKVSFSAQEWCGHVYMQLNRREDGYHHTLHSYFQREADTKTVLPDALLEDAVWTRIRIAPASLPTGELAMIPGTEFLRLAHQAPRVLAVTAELKEIKDRTFSREKLYVYRLRYPELNRTLEIFFERETPYRIEGWRETKPGGFGPDAKPITTKAVATHRLMTAYWQQNGNSDAKLRKKLGLD